MRRLFFFGLLFIFWQLSAFISFSQSTSTLLTAITNNDTAIVSSLLKNGADISVVDDDSDNVLMYAAMYSTAACMKQLLQKGADPNAKNKLGETAILWCSHDLEKTKILLEYKADVNIRTSTGNTAFLAACVGQAQTEMVRIMLQYKGDPLVVNNRKENSLLLASTYGDTSLARLLINSGVDINEKGLDDFTALFLAIKSLNKEMVLWLLANGAYVNVKDSYKATPLSYAVITGDPEMIKALLPKATGIDEQDIDGMTILMWAIYNEHDNPAVIQALLEKGATLHLKDNRGNTALAWALKKGNTATVALLRKAGAKE